MLRDLFLDQKTICSKSKNRLIFFVWRNKKLKRIILKNELKKRLWFQIT